MRDLKSKLTTRNLAIIGIVLIVSGNTFELKIWHIEIHELLSHVGAVILVVGLLQWFFDEESRQHLIDMINQRIEEYLSRRDNLARLGVAECTADSKLIVSDAWAKELIEARTLAIGVHYSDATIARFEAIIRARMAQNKITQILHSGKTGVAKSYLEGCLSVPVNLEAKVSQLERLISTRFDNSQRIRMIPHERVLRYSFVFCEKALWLIFITNTDGYEPSLPAFRIVGGTSLFEFFKRDIAKLGATL
jgi:hypothetical protein